MRVILKGSWDSLNITPTIDADYVGVHSSYFTVGNVTVAGISFGIGFSLFYSDKANAWVLEAIKYAIDYVMGKVTEMSFEMFGDYWKTEQKKTSDTQITAYARSVDALNEVIKLESNQRLSRTLTTYQTECRGVETAQQLKYSQYSNDADLYQIKVSSMMGAVSSGEYGDRAYEGLFDSAEAESFVRGTPKTESFWLADRTDALLKESLLTATYSSITNDNQSDLIKELRFVTFLTIETDSNLRAGLRTEVGDDATMQARLAYGRLATIACRNSVVTGIATREVLNRFGLDAGGTGRNHSIKYMLDNTYYSAEWQESVRTFVDPVPAAAEWVKLLGHRFELIREEYRSNEEVILLLSCLILNRLDSPFSRNVVAKAIRMTNGGV